MTKADIENTIKNRLGTWRHVVYEVKNFRCVVIVLSQPSWWDFITKKKIRQVIGELNMIRPAGVCIEFCYWI